MGRGAPRSADGRLGFAAGASYKFRQDPGPQNALGLVRINMPNKHSVYLHDTPLKSQFGQSARALSSGCVRVERVFDLAAWLLGPQKGWDLARVEEQVASGQKLDVKLVKPVPVHFRLSHRVRRHQRRRPFQARHLWPRFRPSAAPTISRTRSSPSKSARSRLKSPRCRLLTSVSADLLRRPSAAATSLHETRDGEAL